LLENEEYVIDIACGALFTIALTNKGRVFGCGY
jgi:alpha-tubulin suppressor-like RCC1 family protein